MKSSRRPAPFSVGDVRVTPIRPPGPRDEGRWYWRAMISKDGQRRTVWTGRATRAEAQRAVATLVADGGAQAPAAAQGDEVEIVSVENLLAYWVGAMQERLDAGDLKPRSFSAYQNAARQLVKVIGHVHLDRLDTSHLAQYRDRQMAAGRAPQTLRNDLSVMHGAWRWGQDRGLCDLRSLGRVRITSRARVYCHHTPTRREFWSALDEFERQYEARRLDLCQILRLLAATGMRVGEACGLAVEDVDFERKQLRIKAGKTPRTVPLVEPALQVLRVAVSDREEGPVWLKRSLRTDLTKRLQGLDWDALEQPRFSCHGIRRMVVVELLSAGCDPAVEARIIGHSPEVAMRHYREVRREHMDDALTTAALGQRPPKDEEPAPDEGV